MKKFMLRRIGVADDRSSERPSLQDCIEVVLEQADLLMGDVIAGLAASTAHAKGKGSFLGHTPISKTVTDLLSSQASAIKKTFIVQLRLGVYHSGSQDAVEQPLVRFEDLQLLDAKEIDASIELALAQQEVSRCVDDVLPSLNALVSSLLGWITVQPQLNPLKPEVFVRALQACLVQYAPDEQARTALITPAAGLLGVGLNQLYREVFDWLQSQGIEPATPVGAPLGGAVARAGGAENTFARTLVTLDRLRKLLSGEFDRAPGRQDFLHTVPASLVALEDMKLVEPMMKRLAQRASLTASMAPKDESADPQVVREPNQGRQLGQQLGEEVVRMMLDNLTKDVRLLPKVRELINALAPVLSALSQSDPRFFSERKHPARQFLDRLTHRSLGYTAETDEGCRRFLNTLSEAVDALMQGDGDAVAFARVLLQLEEGWAHEELGQRQRHEEAARTLLHAEQRNLLAQHLADDFQQRQRNKDIPELVSGFLRGPWAQVVAQSQLGCADGSADPGGYLALVDDLIWSVQSELTRRNRNRLVQLVPTLLIKLRQGLQTIQYPEDRIAVFFDGLISLHENVFEARRLPPVVDAAEPVAVDLENLLEESSAPALSAAPDSSAFWVAEDEAMESGYLPRDADELVDAAPNPWLVADLCTGVWVELIVNGAWLRAQLSWASPHRTLFMFVSAGGQAHSMSSRTMERLRMQGSIRVVSDGHVVDNALDAVAQTALQNDVGQVKHSP